MKNKYMLISALLFPIIILLLWNIWLAGKVYYSPEIRIVAEGYDPRNLISGHYLQLHLVWEKTNCSQFDGNKCPKEKFNRLYSFYLPEQTAEELDKIINSENPKMELVFAFPSNTQPILKNLLIEDITWDKWLNNRKN